MLKTATQVMIMSCLQLFNPGSGKPWRWPWTTGAWLKQKKTTTKKHRGKKPAKQEFIFTVSILTQLSQHREINPLQVWNNRSLQLTAMPSSTLQNTKYCVLFLFLARGSNTGSHLIDPSELITDLV